MKTFRNLRNWPNWLQMALKFLKNIAVEEKRKKVGSGIEDTAEKQITALTTT